MLLRSALTRAGRRRAHLCKPAVCVRSGRRPDTPNIQRPRVAIYHLSVKTISRSAGRSATAAAAYRAGVAITDARTGEVHDYSRRSGVVSAEVIVPAGAPAWAADRAALWNAAEAAERRKNSTVAREFEVALPAELTAGQRRELAREFGRELAGRHGCAVDVAIHTPGRKGDNRNHHAHILVTTRRMGPEGFGEKTRELDDLKTGEVARWRERWAELANEALRQAGLTARVDHRTLAAQGLVRRATVHLGPAAAGYERRTGQDSRRRKDGRAEAEARQARDKAEGERTRELADVRQAVAETAGTLREAQQEREAAQALRQAAEAGRAEMRGRLDEWKRERAAMERRKAEIEAQQTRDVMRGRPGDERNGPKRGRSR